MCRSKIMISVLLLLIGACAQVPIKPHTIPKHQPSESFAILQIHIEKVPIIQGSGFSMEYTDKGSYIMTVFHVCAYVLPGTPEHAKLPPVFQPHVRLQIVTQKGKIAQAKVKYIDPKNDLCVLFTQDLKMPPLPLEAKAPVKLKKYQTLSNPEGLAKPGTLLKYEGFYSGRHHVKGFNPWDMYTIPAGPGSSGSPILSDRNKVIGVLSHVHRKAPNVTFATPPYYIRDFILKTLCKDLKTLTLCQRLRSNS